MEALKVYVDRLKDGHHLKIKEILPPNFLDVQDEELLFQEPVHISGEIYLAEDHLVMHLTIGTSALLPCSICNGAVCSPIAIKDVYLTEPLEEIKNALFDVTERIRETILLQIPLFTECNQGKCPEREKIKPFLKSEETSLASKSIPKEVTYFPFADL
jgi:uncharacterized metal-binding protein YceD (DUF177 family)